MWGPSMDVAQMSEVPTVSMQNIANTEVLIDLSRKLPASRYFELIAQYASKKVPIFSALGAVDVYEAIRAGNLDLFELHKDCNSGELYAHDANSDEGDAAEGDEDSESDDNNDVDAKESKDSTPAVISAPPEQIRTIEMMSPTAGQMKALGGDAEAWDCVRFITLAFPNQFHIAVRTCIREGVDPSALGPISEVVERAECVDDDVWDALVELYEQSGLGSWPAIDRALRTETAARETRSESQ